MLRWRNYDLRHKVTLEEDGRKASKDLKHSSAWQVSTDSSDRKVTGREKAFSSIIRTLGVPFFLAVPYKGRKTREDEELV